MARPRPCRSRAVAEAPSVRDDSSVSVGRGGGVEGDAKRSLPAHRGSREGGSRSGVARARRGRRACRRGDGDRPLDASCCTVVVGDGQRDRIGPSAGVDVAGRPSRPRGAVAEAPVVGRDRPVAIGGSRGVEGDRQRGSPTRGTRRERPGRLGVRPGRDAADTVVLGVSDEETPALERQAPGSVERGRGRRAVVTREAASPGAGDGREA